MRCSEDCLKGDILRKTRVIPAKAGIHLAAVKSQWIPAFAGMTVLKDRVM
jgi:hypothetical protein